MRRLKRVGEAAAILVLCFSGSAIADEVKTIQNAAAGDWPSYHRTYNAHRYSPLDQINKSNVQRLNVAWAHQAGEITQGLQSTPVALDGIIYYSANFNRIFALDGRTGEEIWHYYPKIKDGVEQLPTAPTARGVAVANGRVFIGTIDGRAIALDQKTGKPVWETQLVETMECGCMFTSPPLAVKDKVIYGSTQGGIPARGGGIWGVDQKTGQKLWYFDPVLEGEEHWGINDFGESSAKYAGVGAWHVGSYDPELDLIYYGTSNPSPWFDWAPPLPGPEGYLRKSGLGARPGDNLYSSSVLALRPDTGELVWHFQEHPHDDWDFDATLGEFVLINKGGKKLMLHQAKSGFVFIYDRTNGNVENVWTINKHVNFVKTIDPKTGNLVGRKSPIELADNVFCPSMGGGRSWNAGSYNPETGVWFNSRQEMCEEAKVRPERPKMKPIPAWYAGADLRWVHPPGEQASGAVDAWDPLTGKKKWSVTDKYPRISTILSTKGGLVFSGDMRGYVYAYNADNGKELWKFNMGSGSRGGIISYMAGGEQYVLVPSGLGSALQAVTSQIYPELMEFPSGATLFAFKVSK
ncbi:MAG TPA: PQQ-binding-like beta-propeller repeat protein [Burkholderiales bacterium]|nr:PQQ-binding-like beta-propeller repeat protein [Burkholderiales bacterium]